MMNKRPIMIRAGHASRATRYRNQADDMMKQVRELRSQASSMAKEAQELYIKAEEQDAIAKSISVAS